MDDEREGILQVGELPVIRRRTSVQDVDISQALRSAREGELGAALAFVLERRAAIRPYEDYRPWDEMTLYLQDRIRENANGAT
jgi:hypothetical protein